MSITEFVRKYGLAFYCKRVDTRPDKLMSDSPGMRHWRVRVKSPSDTHSFALYFSQGSAHTQEPTIEDVLDCLASDASGYDNAQSFEDWASDLGYSTDSRQAERIYRTVKRQVESLRRVLGEEAYQELLYGTERL